MTNNLDRQKSISFATGHRFQWEPAQDTYVLLYPEGLVKLNQTASLILSKVDGKRNLEQIIVELSKQFPDADINEDVESFISIAVENRWIVMNS